MSIHKSKGLEFPVVFLCGTGKWFNLQDLNKTILLHQDIGFGPKVIDYGKKIQYNTLAKEAIRIKLLNETLAEEMRLLYVALTRAKERLIITGYDKNLSKSKQNKESLISNNKLDIATIRKSKSYLEWLELICFKEKLDDILKINCYNKNNIKPNKEEKADYNEVLQNFIKTIDSDNQEQLDKILSWEYQYKESTKIRAKASVTGITHKQENRILESTKEPKFLDNTKKLTAPEIGTLMHLVIQKLDFKEVYTEDVANKFIQNLIARNIITENEAQYVKIDKIIKFSKSNLYKELQQSKQINKEQPFYIYLNSNNIYETVAEEKILVQGIIDLYYINKNDEVVLVDYKTDYITNENELIEKYKEQLYIYKQALEQSLNKKVDKVYIYSIYLNKEINIKI